MKEILIIMLFFSENFPLSDLMAEISTGVETTANSSTSLRYLLFLCLKFISRSIFYVDCDLIKKCNETKKMESNK